MGPLNLRFFFIPPHDFLLPLFHQNLYFRVVIFEQPMETIFVTTSFFLSFHWSKTMEIKKGREIIKVYYEYDRENCQKVVTK